MNKKITLFLVASLWMLFAFAQPERWQQHVQYTIVADLDVNTNLVQGVQKLEYTNNSPDKLDKVFFHLYWNAFQPGSEMDVRSRELGGIKINGKPDWDSRVTDRISKLTPSEMGYQKIKSIKINGVEQTQILHGTILEVKLSKPILPKSKVVFDMVFEAQVPIQIRRSGRDNAEGIRYSMSQWYPKLCEYDYEGWHPAQYVAREFYGVWGNYDVTIKIDKSYKIGGTGVLVNANEIGWGYDKPGTPLKSISTSNRTWHFVGKNVHDFVWAADPNYEHLTKKQDGVDLHVIYKKTDAANDKRWQTVLDAATTVLPYIEKRFGKYDYPQYTFLQGGDGGMEYPMATLIKGPSLGTVFHEWMHSWYQMMLATNENKHPWMDEGFTSWAEGEVSAYYYGLTTPPAANQDLPLNHASAYDSYYYLIKKGLEEPLTTFSDHYETNFGYSINAYSKGEIFLEQLGYIVGDKVRDAILLEYYKVWRFKHPNPDDFIKVAQDVSGIQLDWYQEYWINTTKKIDYQIDSLWEENGESIVRLEKIGQMPMPIDLELTFKDGTKEIHYIPLDLMLGNKPAENDETRIIHDEWNWTNRMYNVKFKHRLSELISVEIDPTKRMADVNGRDNVLKLNW
jgi:hypothetical protein